MTQPLPYPRFICFDCETKHGRREVGEATWHIARCDICGEVDMLTESRDFGHLKSTWKEGKQ